MDQPPPSSSRRSSADSTLDESTEPAGPPLWSKPWLWLGVGLAAAALAYGVGRMQGALALTGVEQRHATAIESMRSNLEACEIDSSLLTARRSLALVALALDRRNFGIAERHRRDASQALEQPRLSALADVASLSTTIRGLNLGVDPDPGAIRDRVIAASEALDRVLAARNRPAAPTPAASVTKVAE